MARPLRIQFPGAFYHVTCRGNERRAIFLDDEDRGRFKKILINSLQIYHVVLHAYVLMETHFHLVVQTLRANLSEFMRHFNICYTGSFNHHHNTCGHLYRGRYKALLVDADNYLLELSRYVHLNPVRIGRYQKFNAQAQWQYIQSYRWSSLLGYLEKRKAEKFVDYDLVLSMVDDQEGYQRFILDGLKIGVKDLHKDVQYQLILGGNDFVSYVMRKHLTEGSPGEQPAYREMVRKVIEPKQVMACVSRALGVDIMAKQSNSRHNIEQCILVELLYRYSGVKLSVIGQLLGGVGYTTVSMMRNRLTVARESNKKVNAQYIKAEKYLHALLVSMR